jgi:hypothetical protein
MSSSSQDVANTLLRALETAHHSGDPYDHWNLENCVPQDIVDGILALPIHAPDLGGVSGKRELHNATRSYFDVDNQKNFPACAAFAGGFQDKRVTDQIAKQFNTDLNGTYLRIEYAQDVDGFWLEPHSDLGVKNFTMLLYLSKDESHTDLGTDIYDADKKHVGRSPFMSNGALVFIPSDITFHGFEARKIDGVRKSIVINYVTDEWRAREQLSFPDQPITA